MKKTKACGVLVFRRQPQLSFLLMKHPHRYDLPKGHIEEGETEEQCALREMWEETGISFHSVRLQPGFRYSEVYHPYEARFGPGRVEKTLVIFIGWLLKESPITVTEHGDFEWRNWEPPHDIQRFTINPLLAECEKFFAEHPIPTDGV
jgi:bis(5'-nucleosidyl)-tetraphosphatase